MSLATSVTSSTLRPQQQLQHGRTQQTGINSYHFNCCNILNSSHTLPTPPQASINCLQQSSPAPPTSVKTSLSTSPIAANYMGSSSLFSFESGVVLSGSSGCCSLSNSPSSSSSSNSYMTSQSLENTCNKFAAATGNQICLNSSTSLEYSFNSATCQLNSSLLTAVNDDMEDSHTMAKSSKIDLNQSETNLHTSGSMQNQNESSDNGQRLLVDSMHNPHAQPTSADNSTLNNEDARTLQLAVELTMMNLSQMASPTLGASSTLSPTPSSKHYQQAQSHHIQHSTLDRNQPYSSPSYTSVGNPYHMTTKVFIQTQSQGASTLLNQKFLPEPNHDDIPLTNPTTSVTTSDERSKKSQNMTECVPVPSSEHVAEIVGRQGKFTVHMY